MRTSNSEQQLSPEQRPTQTHPTSPLRSSRTDLKAASMTEPADPVTPIPADPAPTDTQSTVSQPHAAHHKSNAQLHTLMAELQSAAGSEPMSKRQLKRAAKSVMWQSGKLDRRRAEKERKKLKQRAAKQQVHDEDVETDLAADEAPAAATGAALNRPGRRERMLSALNDPSNFNVCIDCSYDSVMTEREIRSLAVQLAQIYATTARADRPLRLTFSNCLPPASAVASADASTTDAVGESSATEASAPTLTTAEQLSHNTGASEWPVNYTAESYLQHFEQRRTDIVYLTAESTNVLQQVDSHSIYVIGGLVDHNRLPGIAHERATQAGVRTARLPIAEVLEAAKTSGRRLVLTTNHCYDVLHAAIQQAQATRNATVHHSESSTATTSADDGAELQQPPPSHVTFQPDWKAAMSHALPKRFDWSVQTANDAQG